MQVDGAPSAEVDRFGLETALAQTGQPHAYFEQNPHYGARLLTYVALLRRWQKAQNLVSRDTLTDVWTRHIADCAQLMPLLARWQVDQPDRCSPLRGLDLGSGGGLPGLVLALLGAPGAEGVEKAMPVLHMTLVEATARKTSFHRTVSRETGVALTSINARIEDLANHPPITADIITARALAPLSVLVTMARPWLTQGATAFFHKGGEYAREIEEWPDADAHHVVRHTSAIDPSGCILQISRKR